MTETPDPNGEPLVCDELHLQLMAAIPALRAAGLAEVEYWRPDEVPRHVFFAQVVDPHLSERMRGQDDVALGTLAAFFERMAVATDERIGDVLRDTVLEHARNEDPAAWHLLEQKLGPAALADWRRLTDQGAGSDQASD